MRGDRPGLIINDRLCLFIPKHRHRKTALIIRLGLKIKLPEEFQIIQRVRLTSFAFVFGRTTEPPAFFAHVVVHYGVGDDFLETF